MLVLRNGANVMAEGGKPLGNNEVNALKVENTNAFSFGVVTTGPIRVYWGDGSYVDVGVKSSRYNIDKTYGSIGDWNISIAGAENITCLWFDSSSNKKITSNVIWLKQFIRLTDLYLTDASFVGELSLVVDAMKSMQVIYLLYTTITQLTYNVSASQSFWGRCRAFTFNCYSGGNMIKGDVKDIRIDPTKIEVMNLFSNSASLICTDIKNVLRYDLQVCREIYFLFPNADASVFDFSIFNIPDTLTKFNLQVLVRHINLPKFNFKNINWFRIIDEAKDEIDLTSNISFNTIAATFGTIYLQYGLSTAFSLKVDLSKFTRNSYNAAYFSAASGRNKSFGDASNIINKTVGELGLIGGLSDGAITGSITSSFSAAHSYLEGVDVACTGDVFKNYVVKKGIGIYWTSLKNFTGDISGTYMQNVSSALRISSCPNIYADITTFAWPASYASTYMEITLSGCPHFTGDLGNLTLWANKKIINLSNCSYTNIPSFVRKIFANRNTCLKAAGGMTNIQVQGNVDNNLLTGIEQQPPLGSYTGIINDLTEVQIDNLAAGKDYTGSGLSTPWTDKELIWILAKLKNSSTDSSLRYRCTFNY
jgi:hypothetical protein